MQPYKDIVMQSSVSSLLPQAVQNGVDFIWLMRSNKGAVCDVANEDLLFNSMTPTAHWTGLYKQHSLMHIDVTLYTVQVYIFVAWGRTRSAVARLLRQRRPGLWPTRNPFVS